MSIDSKLNTRAENRQNLIIEGCYIPFDWAKDFSATYLEQIRYCCLIMSKTYIQNHFSDIKKFACVVENRLDDNCTVEILLEENMRNLELAKANGVSYVLIGENYDIERLGRML